MVLSGGLICAARSRVPAIRKVGVERRRVQEAIRLVFRKRCGNLRKNNKFILVQEGEEGIPTKSKGVHRIQLIKDGPHIVMLVDDRKIIDWTDNGKKHGHVHTDGKIGFRQVQCPHGQEGGGGEITLQLDAP